MALRRGLISFCFLPSDHFCGAAYAITLSVCAPRILAFLCFVSAKNATWFYRRADLPNTRVLMVIHDASPTRQVGDDRQLCKTQAVKFAQVTRSRSDYIKSCKLARLH